MAVQLASAVAADAPARCNIVLCPPFTCLDVVRDALGSSLGLGAQDLSAEKDGAFTGDISGEMLVDAGCTYVIVGHSERRALHGETDATVAAKFTRALDAGLRPILCVGETLAQREAGKTRDVVLTQVETVVEHAGIAAFASAVIAYEPVWAIGTGRTATAGQAQEVHAVIRERLAAHDARIAETLPILYGGSVKADNAAALFAGADVDGGLIGGASLDADSFLAICRAASE